MSAIDVATVTATLDHLYRRYPHLPRPPGLAQAVCAAWNAAPSDVTGAARGRMAAVVKLTWPIAAIAGAVRGHALALAQVRAELAAAQPTTVPDPHARWVLQAFAESAEGLPEHPDRAEITRAATTRQDWVSGSERLNLALMVGLRGGWAAGHVGATWRLVDTFVTSVVGLVGSDLLTTTFLTPSLPAYALLDQIESAVHAAAEADRTNPPPAPAPPTEPIGSTPARHTPGPPHDHPSAPPPPWQGRRPRR